MLVGTLRHSREMTLPCSRNLTQQPAFGGDDIAFCAFGLGTKTRHLRWVTLSEQKWVILAERRGSHAWKTGWNLREQSAMPQRGDLPPGDPILGQHGRQNEIQNVGFR